MGRCVGGEKNIKYYKKIVIFINIKVYKQAIEKLKTIEELISLIEEK